MPLHAADAPKTPRKHHVATQCVETVGRQVVDGGQELMGDVCLLVLCVSEEESEVDFVGNELHPDFADCDIGGVVGGADGSAVVAHLHQFFFGDAFEEVDGEFLVEQHQVVPQEPVERRGAEGNAPEALENWVALAHWHYLYAARPRRHHHSRVPPSQIQRSHATQTQLYLLHFQLAKQHLRHALQNAPVREDLLQNDDGLARAGAVDVREEDVVEQFFEGVLKLVELRGIGGWHFEGAAGFECFAGHFVAHQANSDVFAAELDDDVFAFGVLDHINQ